MNAYRIETHAAAGQEQQAASHTSKRLGYGATFACGWLWLLWGRLAGWMRLGLLALDVMESARECFCVWLLLAVRGINRSRSEAPATQSKTAPDRARLDSVGRVSPHRSAGGGIKSF